MRIQTLSKDYEILRIVETDARKDILIARDTGQQKTEKYLLVALKQGKDIQRFIPFCAEQKKNKPFDDFMEYFPRDGFLYLVFRYYDCPSLKKRLEEDEVPLMERLQIIRSMIHRMVYLNIPLYLQYEALQDTNLLVDESGTVYFNYCFTDPDRFESIGTMEIWNRITDILTTVFAVELADQSCPPLELFITKVGTGTFSNALEMLRSYEEVYRELQSLKEQNAIKPRSLGFRLWDRIKKIFKYLKYLLLVLVVGALLFYLILTVKTPQYETGDVLNYHYIGTLEIRETKEESGK